MSCTGKLGTPCLLSAQVFHLLNAPMYFLVVLSALLRRTVAGRAAARQHSSGSSRLLSRGHIPEARTSAKGQKKSKAAQSSPANNGWLRNSASQPGSCILPGLVTRQWPSGHNT